jgi:hypothetical protein
MASKSALYCLEVARIVRERPGSPAMLDHPAYLWISLSDDTGAATPTSALPGQFAARATHREREVRYDALRRAATANGVRWNRSHMIHTYTYPHVPITAPPTPTVRIACFAFSAATRQDGKIDDVESECGLATGLCLAMCGFNMKNRSAKKRH